MTQIVEILPYAAVGIAVLSFVRGWLKDRSRDDSRWKLDHLMQWKERNIDKLGEPALAMQRLVQAEEKINDLVPKVDALVSWKTRSESAVEWLEGQRTSPSGSWPAYKIPTRPGSKK